MSWNWMDDERVRKNEIEIAKKIEQLGKRYKMPAVFGRHFVKPDNGDRYAAMHFEGKWGYDCYCTSYSMEDINECDYSKHDLIVLTEVVCNSAKNEVRAKLTTTVEVGLSMFKPVLLIQYCIKSQTYDSTSRDFSIMINPMPIVLKNLNMSKDESKKLAQKTYSALKG